MAASRFVKVCVPYTRRSCVLLRFRADPRETRAVRVVRRAVNAHSRRSVKSSGAGRGHDHLSAHSQSIATCQSLLILATMLRHGQRLGASGSRLLSVEVCGNGDFGRLGQGDNNCWKRLKPVDLPEEARRSGLESVHAGGANSAVLTSSGTILTAGLNSEGQLGQGLRPSESSFTFQPIDSPKHMHPQFVSLSVGRFHSLAACANGTVWAWGRNSSGECGHNPRSSSSLQCPSFVSSLFHRLNFTARSVCAGLGVSICIGSLDSNTPAVITFGDDSSLHERFVGKVARSNSLLTSMFGMASPKSSGAEPSLLCMQNGQQTPLNIVSAACGEKHGMLLDESGHVLPYGEGTAADSLSDNVRARQISCGGRFSAALLHSGGVRLWGENSNGCLGAPDGSRVDLGEDMKATGICAGWKHCAAVTDYGSLYCWGWSGDGMQTSSCLNPSSFVSNTMLNDFRANARGAEGTFSTPGLDSGGQLGVGDRGDMVYPACARSRGALQVACGLNHTIALIE